MAASRTLPIRKALPGARLVSLLRIALAALLLVAVAAAEARPDSSALCGQAGAITAELSKISGFKLQHPVPCDFISKQKVNEFLNKRVKESIKPAEIHAEELTLKKFGLVPRDFDLAKTTVDLLTEQAAAFYDYDKKKLFITETTSADTQEPVLAHELAHALADQNYNLARFIRQGRQSDDGSAARLAVMEGQATWLMAEFVARKLGQSLKDSPELVAAMSALNDAGAQYPVFANSPLYLRLTLVFPYAKGMLFQDAVTRKLGADGFAAVFRRAPVSTQQILHPERYFENAKASSPALPEAHLPKSYKSLVGGVLGEFDHAAMIEQYAGKQAASEISPHWKGSAFELREEKKSGRVALLYSVEWDTEDAARRYFEVYKAGMAKKWSHFKPDAGAADRLTGSGDDGRFELRLSGSTVTSVEGLASELN
jgi:hypothetical protein